MNTLMLFAQEAPDLFQGYEGEWNHVSGQLISLAEATPPEKFAWRPATGVRSTSEVYMHIAVHRSRAQHERAPAPGAGVFKFCNFPVGIQSLTAQTVGELTLIAATSFNWHYRKMLPDERGIRVLGLHQGEHP
jgi:hypothetical protein